MSDRNEEKESSSLILQSYQELYEFLSKPTSSGSDKKVDDLLKPRISQLRKCTDPFGQPNSESKKNLETGKVKLADGTTLSLSDEDKQEALAVSTRFQVDEIEALVLLRSCLIHAEHSTLGTTASATWDADLKDALESYYFQQRIHALRVFLPILAASGDPQHPFHVVATDTKQSIMPEDGTFALGLVEQLERRSRQTLPPSVTSEPHAASRWARQSCREQICALEILFGILWELDNCHPNLVVRFFEVLFSTDCGQGQANSNYLMDEEGRQLLVDLESLWVLVGLQVLALGRISEGATVGKTLMADPTALLGLHNLIVGSFRLKPRYAPLLMAWGVLLWHLNTTKDLEGPSSSFSTFYEVVEPPAPTSPFYQQCAEIALSSDAGLLVYLSQLLDSPVLSSAAAASKSSGVTTPNAYTYRLTIYYLITGMMDALNLSYMSDVDAFLEVVIKLFGSGESNIVASLGHMYWTEDWVQSPKRQQFLLAAALRFPVQPRPLVRLLQALSGSGDDVTNGATGNLVREICVGHVYQYLAEMAGFAHVIQPSHLQSSLYDVRSDTVVNVRPIQLPGGAVLPARSVGQTLSLRQPGAPLAVRWSHSYSGWRVLLDILLEYVRDSRSQVYEHAIARSSILSLSDIGMESDDVHLLVRDILSLFRCIAEGSKSAMGMLMNNLLGDEDNSSEHAPPDLVQVAQIVLKDSLSHPTPGSVDLATNALGILMSLLPAYPGRVWPYLRSTDLLFTASLFATERALGDYTMTCAIIGLVDALRTEARVMALRHSNNRVLQHMKSDVLLKGLTFVHNEIWLAYSSWRYSRLTDRFNIGHKVTELYCAILDGPEQPMGQNGEDVFGPAASFLLDAFLHQATVPCVTPLVSALSSGHELLRSLNNAHRFAEADSLTRLLNSHLRLAQLIIGRKPPSTGLSLLEQTLFTSHKKRSAIDAIALLVEDKLVPLEAIRLLSALTATPASMVSHISSPQRVVDALLRIVRNPYEELRLRIEVCGFISRCIAAQPVFGKLFISGEYKGPQDSDPAPTARSVPATSSRVYAPQIALEIVDNRELLWEVNPELLAAALELLDNVWQRALEHLSALESTRTNSQFWADLSALAAIESDTSDFDFMVEHVTYGSSPFSDRHEVPDICYQRVAKAHAIHIIALDIALAPRKDTTSAPASLAAFEKITKDIRKLLRSAVNRGHKHHSMDTVRRFVDEEVPGLRLDAFRPSPPNISRSFGDNYVLDLSKVKDCAWHYLEDDFVREEWNQTLLVNLCQLNIEWSLADSQIALTRSWVRLVTAAAPWLRSKPNTRTALLDCASDVAELAGSSEQPGDLAASVHTERLNVLLALADALGLSKLADVNLAKQFVEFSEHVQRVITNPRFPPLESAQENPNKGFHCALLQLIYFTAHHGRFFLGSGSKLTAIQRQKIVSTVAAALDFIVDALRSNFDTARSVLSPDLDQDIQLMVLTFGQVVRPELFPAPSTWLSRCQNNDIIRASLELFVRLDLTGQAHPEYYRTNHQALYARSLFEFYLILATYRNSAERLAQENVILAFTTNQLSPALESGVVDVLHIELPGERSPAHRVWCRMLGITTALVGHLSHNSHFVDSDVTSFVRLYRRQIMRTLEWSVSEPLTAPLIDEMLRVVELFHMIAQVPNADNTLGREFVHVAHRLVQHLSYALAHPNLMLNLLEPLTADERVLIEADEAAGGSEVGIVDPIGKPVLARVGMALFKVLRILLSAVMLFVKADNVILKLDEGEWDYSWEKLQPTVSVSMEDNSSIGTMIELGRTAIDVLRHLNSFKTPPAPSRGLTTPLLTLPKFELKVAQNEVQTTLELVLAYSTSQIALWLREPGGERWEREIKGTVADDVQGLLTRAAGAVGGRDAEGAAVFEILSGFLEGKLSG
ncbi:nucleoporin [Ceratobasidium sp. AG-Ba]|nr:nucleoporin [Ceratobasidium sp. AG-Ba]